MTETKQPSDVAAIVDLLMREPDMRAGFIARAEQIGRERDDDRDLTDLELAPYLELQAKPLPMPEPQDTPHGTALVRAVYRAVNDLEAQGPRSERIALQLLEALLKYELALGGQFLSGDGLGPGLLAVLEGRVIGPKLTEQERAMVLWHDESVFRKLGAFTYRHRLEIDQAWYDALDEVLSYAHQPSRTMADKEQGVRLMLDMQDKDFSQLERRVIISYALDRDTA